MTSDLIIMFILCIVSSFVISLAVTRLIIPKLKSKKMGQKILDIGPRWHKSKEGTPTMGGIAFIVAFIPCMIIFGILMLGKTGYEGGFKFIITIVMILLNALIGVIDDWIKVFKHRNEGLSAKQKYLLQFLVAAAYLFALKTSGNLNTALYLPFINQTIELSWFYYVVAIILITGVVNSVNLTDGIDGLCSGVTFFVALFFAIVSLFIGRECLPSLIISAALLGMLPGFLVYNFYPAKIFMGDTGSLFLGGAVIGMAFLIDKPIIIVLAGIIYIIEALSDIIQVVFFKLTKKRVFKMAPIHHHFEKCGWSEIKINIVFCAVTIAACILSFFGLGIV